MDITINRDRLRLLLKSFAVFGETPDGGVDRPGYSDAESAAHDFFMAYMNMRAEPSFHWVKDSVVGSWVDYNPPGYADRAPVPPIVMAGHLDSVPNGGRFDGTLGVAAGMEVLLRLAETCTKTKHPIRVVAFRCEESSRFGRAFIGSSIAAGKFNTMLLDQLVDNCGATLRASMFKAIHTSGGAPWRFGTSVESDVAQGVFGPLAAMLELHIEQGPVLDHSSMTIGVVSSIAKAWRYKVSVFGTAGHTGTTPMHSKIRRDALVVAADIITNVNDLARDFAATKRPDAVATVSVAQVHPNSMNVIPARVDLGIDVRCGDAVYLRELATSITREIESACTRGGVEYTISTVEDGNPVELDKEVHDTIFECAKRAGEGAYTLPGMTSGAGHDCMNFADLTRVGMIFVPSIGGVSHHYSELTDEISLVTGTQLLLESVLELDEKL